MTRNIHNKWLLLSVVAIGLTAILGFSGVGVFAQAKQATVKPKSDLPAPVTPDKIKATRVVEKPASVEPEKLGSRLVKVSPVPHGFKLVDTGFQNGEYYSRLVSSAEDRQIIIRYSEAPTALTVYADYEWVKELVRKDGVSASMFALKSDPKLLNITWSTQHGDIWRNYRLLGVGVTEELMTAVFEAIKEAR